MKSMFISHSWKDKPIARRIGNDLRKYGVDVWIDEASIKIGDSLISKIREGIDKVDFLVALISRNSIESEWVTKELDIAMNQEISNKRVKVLPVLLDDSTPPGFLLGKLYADVPKIGYGSMMNMLLDKCDINATKDKNKFTKSKLAIGSIYSSLAEGSYSEVKNLLETIEGKDEELLAKQTFFEGVEKAYMRLDSDELLLLAFSAVEKCPTRIGQAFITKFIDEYSSQVILSAALSSLIKSIGRWKKDDNLDVQLKVLSVLEISPSDKIKILCLDYFCHSSIDKGVSLQLQKYFSKIIINEENYPLKTKILSIIANISLSDSVYDSPASDLLIKLWDELLTADDKDSIRHLLSEISRDVEDGSFYGFGRESKVYDLALRTFKFSNDMLIVDLLKILISLQYGFSDEIWDKISEVDENVLEEFFSQLSDYILFRVFSNSDIKGLRKIHEKNKDLQNHVIDVLSEMHSKEALETISELTNELSESQAVGILLTSIKYNLFTELVTQAYEKIKKDSSSAFQNACIVIYEYLNGNKDENYLCDNLPDKMGYIWKKHRVGIIIEALKIIQEKLALPEKRKIASKINKYEKERSK